MNILKKIFLALAIVSTLGVMSTYSTVAVAAESAKSGKAIIQETLDHLNAALTALNAGEDKDVINAHVGNARQVSKELSVGALASRVMFAADSVVQARKALKKDDMETAKTEIESAIEQYTGMLPDVL
ncbi:MAG: hypothetical protein KAJ63_01255 [Methyloprofundus sp.]|nr:hypothetical protein [Methyloprofundus sp.]